MPRPQTLTPQQAVNLFTHLSAQQNHTLQRKVTKKELGRPIPAWVHPLPHCPSCTREQSEVSIRPVDPTAVTFGACGHRFEISRPALLAGLAAVRR